jgi:dipeptidyl aminopeptidase/acylaminoacyl peptidase
MDLDVTALTRLPRVGELAVSPDGSWLAVVVQRLDVEEHRYVSDLWRVPVGGGAPVRLTRGASKDLAPRFRRDGALGFLSNRPAGEGPAAEGDDQRMQVWLLPAEGGEAYPLTDEPLGASDFAFAAAADRLVVLAEVEPGVPLAEMRARARDRDQHGPSALHFRETPVRHWDRWLPATALHAIAYDERGGARRDLTPAARHQLRNGPWDPGLAVSADGALVAVAWSELGADRVPDSWIRCFDPAGGAVRDLGRAAATWHANPRFAADGRLAAERVVRRRGLGEITRLCVFAPGDDAGRLIAEAWDAVPHLQGWTADGALLATADAEGHVPVYRGDLAGEVTRITAPEAGGTHEHVRALPHGWIAGVRHRLLHPPEPFVCSLTAGATPRLCAALSGFAEARGAAIAGWQSRWTPGDGGTPVQWFLVEPTRPAGACAPLLVWIHGGPVGQFGDGWHWRWNPLVAAAAGYAVALPNPRGSTGRGQAFIDGVFGNTWGGACYRDLVACVDEAITLPAIDATRVAAMGGSFGGYMANWIGTQTDRFAALVSHAGLFHLPAFYGTTDYPGYMANEFGCHPFEGDPDAYRRYSPDAHVMAWKTPVLLIHGERDYRVPISEALIAFEAIRTAGADAELLVFPDENHWIARPRNIRAWYDAWLAFVDRHLGVARSEGAAAAGSGAAATGTPPS